MAPSVILNPCDVDRSGTGEQPVPERESTQYGSTIIERRTASVDLSVIVPTYRGAERIYQNLCRLSEALSKLPYSHEIVVVSDGNTDGTEQHITRRAEECPHVHAYHYMRNHGKGYALTYGVARSTGRLITFIDGDGDIDPQQIATYIETMEREQADIVVGSKRHPESRVVYPPARRLYSWGYQLVLRLLFDLQVRDTQVGLKVFRREVLEAVLPRIVVKRYAFDLELLVVACHLGYCRIVEAPVVIGQRFDSTVNMGAVRNMLIDEPQAATIHGHDKAGAHLTERF